MPKFEEQRRSDWRAARADDQPRCARLLAISVDFRADFIEFCPKCLGTGETCLVEEIQRTWASLQIRPDDRSAS